MSLPAGAPIRVEIAQLRPQHVASVRDTVSRDLLTESLGRMFQDVGLVLSRLRVEPSGPRFARYHAFGDHVDVEVGMPVATPIQPQGGILASSLPGGPAAHAISMGSYERLDAVYQAVSAWIARAGRHPSGGPWESYVTDPISEPDPERWRTDILWPLVPR